MRRIRLLALTVIASAPVLAARAAPCPPPATFEVTALQSELMVLATACGDREGYNDFMRRYQPYLLRTERELQTWFNRSYGRGGLSAHDRFVTDLANAQSDEGVAQGTDFCPRNATLFSEVMALQRSAQLPDYAAGKALVPPGVATCVVTAAAPKRRILRRRR
ncbi:MAG: hypothetical protein KGI51_09075 [Rhodospirillales bacterium]|nr:hypothetical protein [Rhodospirillales bacterium]